MVPTAFARKQRNKNLPGGNLLRERVYGRIKTLLSEGLVEPGGFIDLPALERDLGLSRTPLRDALLRLEAEGFVTIHSRRGVSVNALDLIAIRDIYQVMGALEGAAISEIVPSSGPEISRAMAELNEGMKRALALDDFDAYYARNVAFHDCYIGLSSNAGLKRSVRILRERLYDFPRRKHYEREWETASVEEHSRYIAYFERRDAAGASAFARDVHWSFAVQERFAKAYYFDRGADRSRESAGGS